MTAFVKSALRRERTIVAATLTLVVLIACAYTLAGVGMEMSAISMTFSGGDGMGAMAMGSMKTPMAGDWSWTRFLLMFAMWWLMMVAMMLPSAAPAVLLYASVLKRGGAATTARPALVFTAGYLLAWAVFSLLATAAQMWLEISGLVSRSTMMLVGGQAGAMVLIAAGIYQFTSLKDRCLTLCRAPAEFIARHHRPGATGALRLGTLHGAYCLGCCSVMMMLLFVGGVMNLFWIVGLAVFVALEKLSSHGHLFTRISGGLLVGFGIAKWFL
ncbi:MAG: DUF2182 domain-containing protein [Leisingera sp.]